MSDETVDVLVAGSAGALAGAYTAAREGLSVALVEATDWFGGTFAYSGGGGMWYPGNPLLAVPWAATPVLLLGCVLLAKGRPATTLGWIGTGLQTAVVSGLSFGLILFGVVLSMLVRADYFHQPGDAHQLVIGGLIAGPFIGVVAMLSRRGPMPGLGT